MTFFLSLWQERGGSIDSEQEESDPRRCVTGGETWGVGGDPALLQHLQTRYDDERGSGIGRGEEGV